MRLAWMNGTGATRITSSRGPGSSIRPPASGGRARSTNRSRESGPSRRSRRPNSAGASWLPLTTTVGATAASSRSASTPQRRSS